MNLKMRLQKEGKEAAVFDVCIDCKSKLNIFVVAGWRFVVVVTRKAKENYN